MRIIDLTPNHPDAIQQIIDFFVEGFRDRTPAAWANRDNALEEIESSFQPDRISRIAIAQDGTVLGWVGAISHYNGCAWELHPLIVRPTCQSQGVGRALVTDLADQVKQRGGITIYLGTDDENNETSLADADLYPNPLDHLASIQNLHRHPYEFYQKVGFVIVGVIPDANGWGKPDILMAKRVRQEGN